jgi:hypothetical protein
MGAWTHGYMRRPIKKAEKQNLVVPSSLPERIAAQFRSANVRFGSKADIPLNDRDVRFTPKATLLSVIAMSTLCQKQTLC